MKYTLVLGLIISMLFFGCKSDFDDGIPACGFENPRQDLHWLKTQIDNMQASTSDDNKYCYVVQATYEGQTVFRFEDCNPLVNKAVATLDCEGEALNASLLSLDELKNQQIIWKPFNFVCDVNF